MAHILEIVITIEGLTIAILCFIAFCPSFASLLPSFVFS